LTRFNVFVDAVLEKKNGQYLVKDTKLRIWAYLCIYFWLFLILRTISSINFSIPCL
jgi:hypothetical protein